MTPTEEAPPYVANLELLSMAREIAAEAIEVREQVRQYKKGNAHREAQIGLAIARIQSIMAEVRRETSRLATLRPKGFEDYSAQMFEASDALQRQRRKLYKMQWKPVDGLDWSGPPPMVVLEQDEFKRLVENAKKAGYKPSSDVLAAAG